MPKYLNAATSGKVYLVEDINGVIQRVGPGISVNAKRRLDLDLHSGLSLVSAYPMDQEFHASGTAAMATTLDNAAAVNAGSGLVTMPATAHGFKVGTTVAISGSTNYDGLYEIQAVAANTFNIIATFTAETFAGTETVQAAVGMIGNSDRWALKKLELHLSAAAATAENFTATLDAQAGAYYDAVLAVQAMAGVSDVVVEEDAAELVMRDRDDLIRFDYDNTDGRTWGLSVFVIREGQ